MSKPRTPLLGAAAAAALLAAALAPTGCAEPADPREDPRLLEIDGIAVTFEDLRPYVEFFASFRPEDGIKTRHMEALRNHVLPLKFAQRAFPAERAEQLALAKGLCDVADNVGELEEKTALMQHRRRENLTRISAKLPVAIWLFDPLHTLAVSEPIELPHGWFVVGSHDYHTSPMLASEYVDALQVGFLTHTGPEWREWWEAEQKRVGDKVTFVHPDYVDDLPDWMTLPKKP